MNPNLRVPVCEECLQKPFETDDKPVNRVCFICGDAPVPCIFRNNWEIPAVKEVTMEVKKNYDRHNS